MKPNRILVVDDDPDMRESVARLLAAAGYVVEVAKDGEQAIDV
jgi:CheY-like chemotaxis protein